MAFDGHQSKFANSLFPTSQQQAGVNIGGGNNGSMVLLFVANPSVSLQEQNTAASYTLWSPTAHDDPYGLISFAQNGIKNRKSTDSTDCDRETDLQGPNILDEADSQDSYYSEGSLPTCNPIWSPKTLREELLQYFQSEAKTQHRPIFPPNYVSCEASSKAQGQPVDKDVEEFYQQFSGLSTNQQWLFNMPNEDQDSYTLCPQKLSPSLPLPNTGNTNVSQVQQSKYHNMPAERDRGNSRPFNNMSDLRNAFRPQNEMNSPFFDSYHEDQYTQSSAKPISNGQYGPQHINQLVSSFQSRMAGKLDSLCRGDFPDIHRQTVDMQQEDSNAEQRKITSPAVSTQSIPAMQIQKQLVGEFRTVQMERNGGARKQTFKRDTFQDLPGFSPRNTDHFQPPKPFPASLNLPNQYQSNMVMYRGNASLPINMDQDSKHHIQQGQVQSRLKPQMQREKKRMPGYLGEVFSTRPLTNTNMRGGDKRQALSQNPNFDHLESMQSQRSDEENSMGIHSVGNTQQLMPSMYPVIDPRRYSNARISSSNFTSRSTMPHRSSVPVMDVGDMMSTNEPAAFYSNVSDLLTCGGESPYHGMASAMTTSVMNQRGLVIQLHFYLDECYEQWRCLNWERRRAEVILSTNFFGNRIPAVGNAKLPKTNPKRMDHLIRNHIREQARVVSLLDRMESLHNAPLHMNIHKALSMHHMAICITEVRRKEEVSSMSKHKRQRAHSREDRDTFLMVIALQDLAAFTRKIRTALWCALQITLPKPVQRQDHHVNREDTHRERGSSPFEGYSFKL